ncbi:MAG: lipopolysaccharide ABC transporter ATP-binding protein, partial [Gammaproteobacteria bacterium]
MSNLCAQNLIKQYGDRNVVDGVSLNVSSGEIIGLLGPNGAGKTTSFYMIVGLVSADKGEILIDGKAITDMPMHARAQSGIGYLPQEPSIFRKLSVEDNLRAVLQLRKDLTAGQQELLIDELLQEFGLT